MSSAPTPDVPRPETCPALFERSRQGDRAALEELFRSNRPFVLSLVRRRLGGNLARQETVEDLLQDVLTAALQHLHGFRPMGREAFQRWLTVVTTNVVRGRARYWQSEKRDPGRCQSLTSAAGTCEPLPRDGQGGPTPLQAALRVEELAQMDEALANLPAQSREVIRLRLTEERSWGEIASAVGAPTANAAQMRYLRILEGLRGRLDASGSLTRSYVA